MPYTRITSTKNVAACIEYMRGHGHGHNAEEVRNQYVSGIGLLNDGAIPFDVQMGWTLRHRNSRNKVDAFRVIQGFGPEELNADNPEDVFLAHQIGLDLAEKMWPGHQVAVFTQTDGKGHKVHNHLVVCNVNTETYKGCDRNSTLHAHIKEKSDEICGQFFEIKEAEPVKDKVSQTVRAKREKNAKAVAAGKEPEEYIWQDDLKARIKSAVRVSTNMDELYTELVKRGVEMDVKKPTKKFPEGTITYELTDTTRFDGKIPRNLKSRASRLGTDYDIETISRMLETNAILARGRSNEGIQGIIDVGNTLSAGDTKTDGGKPSEGVHTEEEQAVEEPKVASQPEDYSDAVPLAVYDYVWDPKRKKYRLKDGLDEEDMAEAEAYYEGVEEAEEPVQTTAESAAEPSIEEPDEETSEEVAEEVVEEHTEDTSGDGSDEGQEEVLTVSDEELAAVNDQISHGQVEPSVYTEPMTVDEVNNYMADLLIEKLGMENDRRHRVVVQKDFSNWRSDRKKNGITVPLVRKAEDGKFEVNKKTLADQIAIYYESLVKEKLQRELEAKKRKDDTRSAEARRKKMELEARRRGMMLTLNNDLKNMKDDSFQKG